MLAEPLGQPQAQVRYGWPGGLTGSVNSPLDGHNWQSIWVSLVPIDVEQTVRYDVQT